MKFTAKKLRPGLYRFYNHLIEKLDERAERYPSDLDYGKWQVSDHKETWLATFSTLDDALRAIYSKLFC